MATGGNNVVLLGSVATEPKFIQSKKGVEFAARFMLSVRKGYRKSNGSYETDLIPVRIQGEKRMGFARMLQRGDRLCVSGSVSSEQYTLRDGNEIHSVLIDADQIEWTGRNFQKAEEKKNTKKVESVHSAEIRIELPFA